MNLHLDTTVQELDPELKKVLAQVEQPQKDSHKGQNGKLLLIGGSELFHAASKWSLDTASYLVDMVFYSSVSTNNELVQKAKQEFWNGIVVERDSLEDYVQEADCVLIGPGMERTPETRQLVSWLLSKYPEKKVVIDAGALQMVEVQKINENHILTPHTKEMMHLEEKLVREGKTLDSLQATVLKKGQEDRITWFSDGKKNTATISGGNAGMTKGGTGDVLAGLVAGLYCSSSAEVAAVVGSYVNKLAGDKMYSKVGPYFNASDLVEQIPKTLWQILSKNT